jgi:hypothetical protein
MQSVSVLSTALTHQIYGALRHRFAARLECSDRADRDRGAASLEQVLWFVAAGVSVAVIASILWGQIKDKADDPITPPAAP